MGTMSRNKGKRAEREVIDLLQPVVDAAYAEAGREPPLLQRNTLQSDRGGYDVVGLDWLALEVKHVETSAPSLIAAWWRQCVSQAKEGTLPVLFYRRNQTPFRVRLQGVAGQGPGNVAAVVEIAVEDFQWFLYRRLQHELAATSR